MTIPLGRTPTPILTLTEVANNLFDGDSATSLRRLLASIRAVAPAAAIVFVNWLRNLVGASEVIEKVARLEATD